jgi:ABC-type Na+ efflux pump permease subunit
MSGLLALGIQDFKRLLKNALFWVITATLVIIVAVVNFALPASISEESYSLYSYNTAFPADSVAVDSEEELRRLVREEGGVGLMGNGEGLVTVLHTGLSDKTIRAILLLQDEPAGSEIDIESLHASRTIPFNQRMTPVFICFEALIVGFVLGGALMLSEKEERTIRALRVSPVGVDRYLLSKTLLFSIIAALYALLMAVFCVGFGFSFARFLLLSFFGAAIFSLIGLAFSSCSGI